MIDKNTSESLHRYLDALINRANKERRDEVILDMVHWIHEILANIRTVEVIRWRREQGLD